jgi:Flp pilus assembly pilin Flp
MSDVKAKWNETGAALSGLGAKLRTHYHEQGDRADDPERQAVGDALARLGDAVREAFDAVGAAAKDPAVREDARRAATTLSDALVATFEEAGRDVREAYEKRRGSGPGDGPDSAPG